MTSLAILKPKNNLNFFFFCLNHFPFFTLLADTVTSLPAAIFQLQQFTVTCKQTPLLLCLILDELILTLFQGTTEAPRKTPEVLLARGGLGTVRKGPGQACSPLPCLAEQLCPSLGEY